MSVANKILRPKLEAGINASNWSPCSVYTSSLIKQTADGILLQVDEKIKEYNPSGDVGSLTERVGQLEVTASGISQTVSAHTKSISGNTYNIGQLSVRADRIEGRVTEIENGGVNPNLFPQNGWLDKDEKFINPTDDGMYFASGSTITSPKIHLEVGLYTASNYNTSSKHFTLSGTTGTIKPTVMSALTETYNSATRNYETYNVTTAGDYKFIYGTNGTDSTFYRPKLESGSGVTVYDAGYIQYSSLISQTSKEIELKVEEKVVDENGVIQRFKETGIDITSGRIELNADNTDINGNLRLYATNDADALTLHDSNGIARTTVTSQEIGGLSSQSLDASKTYNASGVMYKNQSTIWDFESKYYPANSIAKAGATGYGRIAYYVGYYYDESLGRNNGRVITSPNSCKIELQLVCVDDNGETVLTFPQQQTTQNYSTYYLESRVIEGNDSVTITKAGNYKPRVKVTWADGTTTSPFNDATNYSIQCYMSSESPSKTIMGADGIYMTNGVDDYIYYGTDGFATCNTSLNGQYVIGHSSCGTLTANYDANAGAYTDTYLRCGGKTGPSHMADFNGAGTHWTNAQHYGNLTKCWYDEILAPSTDIAIVQHTSYTDWIQINLCMCEFNGHFMTIKCYKGKNCQLVARTGTKFKYLSGYGMTTSNVYQDNFNVLQLVYMSESGSDYEGDGTHSGVWEIIGKQ